MLISGLITALNLLLSLAIGIRLVSRAGRSDARPEFRPGLYLLFFAFFGATSLIVGTIAVSSVIGAVSAGALFLTFFPTERHRRWIESRAVALGV